MSPKYFQGLCVTGPVRASDAEQWKDFVDVLRIVSTLPIKRADFLALDKKQRNEIKIKLPFYVPATFKSSPSKRVYSEAVVCNLLFLDLDELPDGRCPAAPFVNNPDSLYTALGDLNFAAYTTVSSTPEKPRMRIVVDSKEIPLSEYAKAVETIGAMLALPKVTTESKVAVQAMFLPCQFIDDSDEDHPLIAHRFDGRTFTRERVQDVAMDEWEAHSANGTNGKNGVNGHGPDALFFLKAPIPEISLSIAKEALAEIDPDLDRAQWRDVAAALRHQFSPHKDTEAYQLFDEWSSNGKKYEGEEDTQNMWRSLRPSPVGRMPVTIRTLLHKAVASGWNDQRVKENSYNKLLDWMEHVETATELLEQGVHKILAAPLMSAVQEDMLVDQLRVHAKRRFAVTVPATAIRKDIGRLRAEIKAQERSVEKVKEPMWARGVCYISAANQFYRHRTGEKFSCESFDATYSRWLLPTEDSLKEAGLPVTPATLSRPIVPPSVYARNHLKVPALYDYSYDPSQPTEMFFVNRGVKYVNTYSPSYPEMDPANAPGAGKLFLGHLQNLIAEEEYRRTLIDFMAFMVQSPGRKIRWGVLIQGAEGCGKTFLAELMKAVLGKEHVKTIDGTTVVSGWNEWAFGYQLVVLEEVRVQGTNRHDIMNRLKPWITNDDIPINEKFRSSRDVRNVTNYMLFSNHHDSLALTPGDRRYFVIKSAMQTKAQVQALGDDYFHTLFKMLRDHPGAMRSWLAEWDIHPDFRADGHAPRTKYTDQLINDSATDLLAAVRRLLLEGDYPLIQFDIVSAKALMDVLRLMEGMPSVTGQQVAHVLREEGFNQLGRTAFGDERHYLWARSGVTDAVGIATERFKKNAKNLHMELIFS